MKKIFLVTLTALSFFPFTWVKAQKINNLFIAGMTETYSFPFTRLTPVHPGLEVGISWYEKTKQNGVHSLNTYIGGYYHKKVENGLYLKGEYVYTYKFKNP